MPEIQDNAPVWQLMPNFVLRSPGFPFTWLMQLHFSQTVNAIQRYQAVDTHRRHMQQTFAEEIFPPLCDEETAANRDKSVFRFWYRLARRIHRGQSVGNAKIEQVEMYGRLQLADWLQEWQNICQQRQAAQQESKDTFQTELETKRRILRQFVQDPLFQEALWLSNPNIYEVGWRYFDRHWQIDSRPSKIKHLERRFYIYLQRFCAKNDTTSFFGPLNYGRFHTRNTSPPYRLADQPVRQRRVFFAYWAVQTLANQIAKDPAIRSYLRPRPNPLKQYLPPDSETAELYRLSNGRDTVTQLACTRKQTLDSALAAIEQLVKDNWLYLDIPIPPASLDPLAYLIEQIQVIPTAYSSRTQWLTTLLQLQQTCADFATADLSQRQAILRNLERQYTSLTNSQPRRGQGKIFQDRTLIYEECLGDLENLHLSHTQRQHITQALSPIATLSATYAQLIRADLQAIGRQLFNQLSPNGEPLPFIHFIAAWRQKYPRLPPLPNADQLEQQLAALITPYRDQKCVNLTAADILALCQPLTEPIVFSPDVLLAAHDWQAIQDNNYQIVIGEIHHGIQLVGWMLAFVEDPTIWQQQIIQRLPQPTPTTTPANLLFGRRMKTAPPEFAGPSVQAPATSLHPSQSFAIGQLTVKLAQGASLQLNAPDYPQALIFYPPTYHVPESLYAPFACFSSLLLRSVPVQLKEHTPRIEIDGTLYQREQWHLPSEALPGQNHTGTSHHLILDYLKFQAQWDLPRHIFVKTPQEPKPIYIDLHNYFALELLIHLAQKTDAITLAEMYPTPEQLWLQKSNQHYTCELRTVLSVDKT